MTVETSAPGLDVWMGELHRTFDLEDISIRSSGDGRTVEAYAAPFDQETEITDLEGHYYEVVRRGAFQKSITEHERGANPIRVFFNHGRTFFGGQSSRFEGPVGQPVEIKEDNRGLWTVTRYLNSDAADEVLEFIRNGLVTHQSVTFGRTPNGGGTKVTQRSDGLPLVERMNVRLFEYGPALNRAAYPGAEIVGVRTLADQIDELTAEQRHELIQLLEQRRTDPEAEIGTSHADRADPSPSDEELLLRNHELRRARETQRR